MNFLYPSVFWIGLPAIALPLAIHLLNLRRRKVVPWAAMDFLLDSQQQSRSWIQLQELLLLLLRTAAIALVVIMLARPTARSGWVSALFDRPVHHLVLLDDSYSMSDRWGETSAWQEAVGATMDIIQAAADQNPSSVVTVLMSSETDANGEDPRPALFRQPLNSDSRAELTSRIETSSSSDKATKLITLLRRALVLCDLQPAEQDLAIHVVSDFRQIDLVDVDALQEVAGSLAAAAQSVDFVRAVRQQHSNLAITQLQPESGVRAANVEMWMTVEVTNYGPETAREVIVELTQDANPLISVPLGSVAAGDTVDKRFRVTFADAGPHWLSGTIDADSLELDNQRVYAVDLPTKQQLLLVDGSPGKWESYYLATSLAPGGQARSGWLPKVISPKQLSSAGELGDYSAVALLDVPRLDEDEIGRLTEYVKAGGGLYVTLGESIDREFYRDAGFADGTGILPAPPALPTQWLSSQPAAGEGTQASDIRVSDHPIYRVLRGERNSMLALMRVNYYYALESGWRSAVAEQSSTRVLATLAGGEPLVIEKSVGKGKVIQQLTQVSPREGKLGSWSNWGPNPAFVVLANELFGYLADGTSFDRTYEVGSPLSLRADGDEFGNTGTVTLARDELPYQMSLEGDPKTEDSTLVSPPLQRAGLYEIRLNQLKGGTQLKFAGVQVTRGEGNLSPAADSTLRQKFGGEKFSLRYADEITQQLSQSQSPWTDILLPLIAIILVAEQALSYVCSFHD